LYILLHRITVPTTGNAYHVFNNTIEDIMVSLVYYNAIDPVDVTRIIPNLVIEGSSGRGESIQFQTRYKNLLEELTTLSKSSGLGITIDLDYHNKQLIFKVLEGKNLSANQNLLPPAIFSVDYDNIKTQTYIDSNIGYKSCGYVAGQGEGEDREITTLNNTLTGLDRREIFIDARDITGEGSLVDRGVIKLAESQVIQSFGCEVEPIGYRDDWDIGDIVTTISKKYGLKIDNRVSEIQETYETGAVKIEPTFGSAIPTVVDKIKTSVDSSTQESIPGATGPQGIPGIDGPQGIPGADGNSLTFNYSQIAPSALWYIEHNLGKRPSVTIVDSGGSVVIGGIQYIDNNNITITFSAAFSGNAYLN